VVAYCQFLPQLLVLPPLIHLCQYLSNAVVEHQISLSVHQGPAFIDDDQVLSATAIMASFRANGSPPLSARFAGKVSHRTNRQNTVPEHVSTRQDNHNK